VISFGPEGSGRAVIYIQIKQAKFFSPNHFGVRMVTVGTNMLALGSAEVMAAILTMMTDGQDVYAEPCTFGHGTPGRLVKRVEQALHVEGTAAAYGKVNGQNSARSNPVGGLVNDLQNVSREFMLVHTPPRKEESVTE
jgi:hypothetical protein